MAKKLTYIFILAFLLNFAWESLHVVLYAGNHSKMLPWATLFDAVFITALGFLFLHYDYLRKRIWLSVIIGIVAAVIIEYIALASGWWTYNPSMPRVPLLGTGLTPTMQLGLLSYIIFKLARVGDYSPRT